MNYFKTLFALAAIQLMILHTTFAQYRSTASKEGIYVKIASGRAFSTNIQRYTFEDTWGNRSTDVAFGPGAGGNILLGTGLRTKLFDFELNVEESIQMAFASAYSNGNSTSSFFTFCKTNLYGAGFVKIPLPKDNAFRIGGGAYMIFPAKLKVKESGILLGYARYNPGMGYFIDMNLMLEARKVYVNPGFRVKLAELQCQENTFSTLQEELDKLDMTSIDIYLAFQF